MKHIPAPTRTQARIIADLVDHPRSTCRQISERIFYTYCNVWKALLGMRAYVIKHRCYPARFTVRAALNWNPRTEEVMAE